MLSRKRKMPEVISLCSSSSDEENETTSNNKAKLAPVKKCSEKIISIATINRPELTITKVSSSTIENNMNTQSGGIVSALGTKDVSVIPVKEVTSLNKVDEHFPAKSFSPSLKPCYKQSTLNCYRNDNTSKTKSVQSPMQIEKLSVKRKAESLCESLSKKAFAQSCEHNLTKNMKIESSSSNGQEENSCASPLNGTDTNKAEKFEVNNKFQHFLDFVKVHANLNPDEEAKILKVLETRFQASKPEYVISEAFHLMVEKTMKNITVDSKNIFVHVLDLCNELKAHKKAKQDVDTAQEQKQAAASSSDSLDERRAKCIKKLEKLLKKLHRKIESLQSRELTLDEMDQEDSYYIREEKLKKKFVQVYKLICKEKKCSTNAGREIFKKFRYSGTKYEEINKGIENLVNRKNIFPDYTDIYNVVKSVSEDMHLAMTLNKMNTIAMDVFSDVGRELKRRREIDDEYMIHSYVSNDDIHEDPAESDPNLKAILDKSVQDGDQRIQDIIDKYVMKQDDQKEAAVEVPDDAPSSGPEEDDEEEEVEEEDETACTTNLDVSEISSNNDDDSILENQPNSDTEVLEEKT